MCRRRTDGIEGGEDMKVTVQKLGFVGLTLAIILFILLVTHITKVHNNQQDEFMRGIPQENHATVTPKPSCVVPNIMMRKPKVANVTSKKVAFCKGCKEIIAKVSTFYAEPWKRQEDYRQEFISQIRSTVHGAELSVVTQAIAPLGSKIYDSSKKTIKVTLSLFNIFPKEPPFRHKTFDTCSVVGSGGILADSHCGKQIDSAQFVFRFNLPPLTNGFQIHVGNKTDFLTANPSILWEKFDLKKDPGRFLKTVQCYGNSWFLFPAFTISEHVEVCLKAINKLKETGSSERVILLNPLYVKNLSNFWKARGLKEFRLSSGFLFVNLALELCNSVDLYGFWPFGLHPHKLQPLPHHYYDNNREILGVHSMPAEFEHLLKLHKNGVLRIHLGDCKPQHSNSVC